MNGQELEKDDFHDNNATNMNENQYNNDDLCKIIQDDSSNEEQN